LIVIAIIGILAVGSMTLINPLSQIQKANDAKRKADLSQIQKALEIYYNDYGAYPLTGTGNIIATYGWGTQWLTYISKLPIDPSTSRTYVYCSSGQSYYLYASLEKGGPLGSNNCGVPTICGTGSPICNYGVSSSNVSP